MAEKMYNVREKLSHSRNLCFNLSERLYLLADYMAEVVMDSVTSDSLATSLETVSRDLYNYNWQGKTKNRKLQEHLLFDVKRIRNQIPNFPTMIDALADKSFAQEFRAICKKRYGFNPPPYGTKQEYPQYVEVAVEWWLNTFSSSKSYSKKELQLFRTTIAREIMEDIMAWDLCSLSIGYLPCEAIELAMQTLGISQICPTTMIIRSELIEIKVNGKTETLWKA